MFALLALASAVCYGAADFLGGLTSKKASTLAIVVVSQFAGLLLLFLMLPLLPAASPVRADYLWGGLAGLTGGIGVALLYRALAVGVMAVVAPTTAVCAVIIPVVAAVALGDRPGSVTIGGIALAIVAIALVSQSTHPDPTGDDADQKTGARRSAFHLRSYLAWSSDSSTWRLRGPAARPACGRWSPREACRSLSSLRSRC